MNIRELILLSVKYENIDSILDLFPEQSRKGFIFERLFDICIKFGLFEIFQSFDHMIGNANEGKLKKLTTLSDYILENVISGNSGGCSDISLYNKITDTYIFISSKFPKSTDDIKKEKSVAYYELQNIGSVILDNIAIYKNYKIYLLVRDKKSVLEKVKKSNKSSLHITKHMTDDSIFDKNDLQKCFTKLRLRLLKHIDKGEINFDELFFSPKSNLELRFHQEIITDKTLELMRESHKSFLWGCKCRSGKTFMTGGLIMKHFDLYKKTNILIITPAPTETAPQFTDDLFRKFKEFEQFEIHPIHGSESLEKIVLGKNNIFIMSKQLLQRYIEDETIVLIKNLNLDIIIFDENHFSGTTDLSKSILDSYSSKNTVKVYLTATYNKPLQEWNIPRECQMYWDIEDESICKSIHNSLILKTDSSIDMRKLFDKHGEDFIRRTIKKLEDNGSSIEDIFFQYKMMPELYLITSLFDSKRYDDIKREIMGTKYGFCFDVLFALNEQKTRFQFENEVKTILRFISGSNRERDFKDGDKSIFSRIFGICSENDTRQPFTQIWFLPSDNINEISICLSNLMKEDRILKKYNIMCVNRKNKQLAKDVKDEIIKQEKIAKHENKDGLILLAGNMLTLGITLNLCDLVILLNNVLSFDKVLQQMYRCMTEGESKKYGFVVDLSISRVLNTCINYTIHNNDRGIDEKIGYLIENHLITIDDDMMKHQKINTDEFVSKLMNIWKLDPVNSFKSLLRNLEDECIEFDSSTQKKINTIFMNSLSDKELNAKIEISNSQELPSGKHIVKNESDISTVSDGEEKKVKSISFTKDILPYILPLTCILTISNTNKDFVRMLNDIQENPELLDIFDDMCLKWWNEKNLINFIKEIICNYFDKKTNTYNISIQFKMSLQSLIDKPKELLELIDSCLKPKKIETKKYGEVFTPMHFINDMLIDFEEYMKIKKNISIFEEENIKWFDPTVGMGNFIVAIYYKLMEGLKIKIPNEKNRKKHIIENMLYMAESGKKNCFIIKQIFNINNEFKLNLYEGDSLKLDIKKEFGINNFDIGIGNPPYNDEFKKSGANPIYNYFVDYYIGKCKYLCFVIPSRWFSGGKGLDIFRKNMLKRTDIVYIKHFEDASKIFGNSVSIEGGVNYFLKDSEYNDLCMYNNCMTKLNRYDIFVDSKFYNLIDYIQQFESLKNIYLGRYFGIESNDKRLKNDKTNDTIKCYVSQQKGFEKNIEKKDIIKDFNFWKIITARANGGNGCFGNTFIGTPNEIHTGSYISFKVKSENEAKSLLSYLKCRLPNLMLSLRKPSQDISESTCKWIPLPPLIYEWTDEKVYKHFNLSNNDIELINNTKIIGFYDILTNKPEKVKKVKKVKIQIKKLSSSKQIIDV